MTPQSKKPKPTLMGADVLRIERLELSELDADEVADLQARFGAELLERKRVELAAENEALLKRLPPEQLVPGIQQRARLERDRKHRASLRRSPGWYLAWGTPLAAAAALLLAFTLGVFDNAESPRPGSDYVDEWDGIKGHEPRLHIYRAVPDGDLGEVVLLENGSMTRPGDTIQVGYIAGTAGYGVLVSIDGTGAVTLHAPELPNGSSRLEGDGEVLLGHGFRLDDAPLFERFIFVTAASPIPVDSVVDSALRLGEHPDAALEGALDLPEDWEQTTFTLRKDSR